MRRIARFPKSYRRGIWLEGRFRLEHWLGLGHRFGLVEAIALVRNMTRNLPRNYDRIIVLVVARTAHPGLFEAGRDHRDLDRVFHLLVQNRAEDDVGIFVSGALNDGASLLHFGKLQRIRARDVDENAAGSVDRARLEQRRRDGALRRFHGAMLAGAVAVPITA